MGFFSWKTQDTGISIANAYSSLAPPDVTMTDNKGNRWHEKMYEGYGIFGGKDYYELVAEMNGYGPNRYKGIELSFQKQNNILFPNLTEDPTWVWRNEAPEICEFQGFFYN